MNWSKLVAAAALALGAVAWTADTAGAATRIGATALEAQAQGAQDCFGRSLWVQESSVGASYVIPRGGGVLTSWSVHGFGAPAQLTLKTVRDLTPGNYLVTASSVERTVAPSGTTTFPARIAVEAGDSLALWVPNESSVKAPCNYVTHNPGDVPVYVSQTTAEPAIGTPYGPVDQMSPGMALNVSARLEPDADRDGYGDESQDACPADPAARTAPCPDRIAPRTRITKAPRPTIRTKMKRVRVSFRFRSSEPGTTYSCTLDGKKRTPCSSPFRATVRTGDHRFSVVSTDAAGNADASPATARFTVEKRRGRRR